MNEKEIPLEHQLDYENCLNCGEDVQGDNFCPNCGQKRTPPEHLTVKYFLKQTFQETASLDSKFIRTFKNLFFNPGYLTKEYLAGRKKLFISPVKIYLIASAAFFFLSWGIMMQAQGLEKQMDNEQNEKLVEILKMDKKEFVKRYEELTEKIQSYVQFLNVIVLALIIFALYFKVQPFYVEHLVFALHYKSFTYLSTTIYLVSAKFITYLANSEVTILATFLIMPIYLIYLFLALRKNYQQSNGTTAVKTAGVFAADLTISGLSGLISAVIAIIILVLSR